MTEARGVRDIRQLVASGQASAAEICTDAIARMERVNPALNAFNLIAAERAMDRARDIDRRRASGETLGPLAGVPVVLKDNMCVRGMRTTASSKILDQFVPPAMSWRSPRALRPSTVTR